MCDSPRGAGGGGWWDSTSQGQTSHSQKLLQHTQKTETNTEKGTWFRKENINAHTCSTVHKHKVPPKPVNSCPLPLYVCLFSNHTINFKIELRCILATWTHKGLFFTLNNWHCSPAPVPPQTVVFLLLAVEPQRLRTGSKHSKYIFLTMRWRRSIMFQAGK